jgi:hypothetical protein
MGMHFSAISVAAHDPNWFLSTSVQSAAALVAIIGGFLITRLIATISERSTLLHHLKNLESRKQISQDAADLVRIKIQARTDDWFIDDHLEEIIDAKGNLDIAKLAENFWGRGHDQELTQHYGERLADITARAFKEILEIYGTSINPPDSCDELRSAGISIRGYEEELIFPKVAQKLEKRRSGASATSGFAWSLPSIEPLTMPVITPPHVHSRHDANIAKELDLKTNVALADAEISLIKSRLSALSNPKPFVLGFGVLAYFGGVGIFYPLHFMTKYPVQTPLDVRTKVYVGFLSGFVVLLLYIANDVWKLREAPKSSS